MKSTSVDFATRPADFAACSSLAHKWGALAIISIKNKENEIRNQHKKYRTIV